MGHPCVLFLCATTGLVFLLVCNLGGQCGFSQLAKACGGSSFWKCNGDKPVKEDNSFPVSSLDSYINFEKEVQQLWVLCFISSCDCFGELEFDQIGESDMSLL